MRQSAQWLLLVFTLYLYWHQIKIEKWGDTLNLYVMKSKIYFLKPVQPKKHKTGIRVYFRFIESITV